MEKEKTRNSTGKINRREFLETAAVAGIAAAGGLLAVRDLLGPFGDTCPVFIAKAREYKNDLSKIILAAFKELGINGREIYGKKILLKPNLVEPHLGIGHINTHPLMVRAAIEAFLNLGAKSVIVAEGSGHRRDTHLILEESGFINILSEDKVPFVDLNTAEVTTVKNRGGYSSLKELVIPRILLDSDIIASMAKLKTHHWVGVTLSMKNMFGIMPGLYYGWPKNVLHQQGIEKMILDINSTIKTHLAIIDGIIGMEGDGPIMGTSVKSEVIIIGKNLPAVDATCTRIMGINPHKIEYMRMASKSLGPISENLLEQRGETISSVRRNFKLLQSIPSHRGISL